MLLYSLRLGLLVLSSKRIGFCFRLGCLLGLLSFYLRVLLFLPIISDIFRILFVIELFPGEDRLRGFNVVFFRRSLLG